MFCFSCSWRITLTKPNKPFLLLLFHWALFMKKLQKFCKLSIFSNTLYLNFNHIISWRLHLITCWFVPFHFLIFGEGPLVILIGCIFLLSPSPDIIGYLHQQFRTVKLWSSLPAECFPLTCVLDGFKPRVDRSLLSLGYF